MMETAVESRRRVCDCGRNAVEKVAGSRSPNQGLRYLCCDRFVSFGKRKNCCRFFEWIDPPRTTQEQRREAQVGKCRRKDVNIGNDASRSASKTRSSVSTSILQPANKKRSKQDAIVIAIESSAGAQNSVDHGQAVCMDDTSLSLRIQTEIDQIEDLSGAEQQHSSSSHRTNHKRDEGSFEGAAQPITPVGHVADFCAVHNEELTANQDDMQSHANVHEISETPSCFCSRAALLKTVKSRGPNQGLRFWVCSNSRPFYVKKKRVAAKDGEKSCKYFRWFDTPSEMSDKQRSEEKQVRKENRKRRELSILS
ncbi:hypothetical protein L7F22_056334 [Adiantum nelumboides]|nr:hypothetical protein [Adiantum nelumboides]